MKVLFIIGWDDWPFEIFEVGVNWMVLMTELAPQLVGGDPRSHRYLGLEAFKI